jgi:hypothetical protein
MTVYGSAMRHTTITTEGNKMTTAETAEHKALSLAWIRYGGRRGTAKQLEKLDKMGFTLETLRRVCADRGIVWVTS